MRLISISFSTSTTGTGSGEDSSSLIEDEVRESVESRNRDTGEGIRSIHPITVVAVEEISD